MTGTTIQNPGQKVLGIKDEYYLLWQMLQQIGELNGHIGDNFNGFRNAYTSFDVDASPLLAGVPQNTTIILPAVSAIKRITVAGIGIAATAATVDIGPVTDDPTYITPSPAQITAVYDFATLGTVTATEQAISLEAQGGDVTAGVIHIWVDYIYIPS